MPTPSTHIEALLRKWYHDQSSPSENEELFRYLSEVPIEDMVTRLIQSEWTAVQPADLFTAAERQARNQQVLRRIARQSAETIPASVHRVHFIKAVWFRYAAVLLLLIGTSAYFFYTSRLKQHINTIAREKRDIAPGSLGTILTLADGRQVVLDSLGNGVIATQNGAQLILKGGQLGYKAGPAEGNIPQSSVLISYNTMSTPKGRQFQVVLPDGTKVWLNAASSLKYPTVFAGKERKVVVTGEAYFEVAKNARLPFLVNVNNKAEIEVLGTHFNVNAYENEESINTTLLEGSIAVAMVTGKASENASLGSDGQQHFSSNQPVILKPGQGARVLVSQQTRPERPGEIKIIKDADIDKVMAWKNGVFNFEDVSLVEAMRQLERWYDIEVVYEHGAPNMVLTGKMTRGITLNDLIEGLRKIGVQLRLEGSKVISDILDDNDNRNTNVTKDYYLIYTGYL